MGKVLTRKQLVVRAATDPRADQTAVGRALREAADRARKQTAKGGRS